MADAASLPAPEAADETTSPDSGAGGVGARDCIRAMANAAACSNSSREISDEPTGAESGVR